VRAPTTHRSFPDRSQIERAQRGLESVGEGVGGEGQKENGKNESSERSIENGGDGVGGGV
jgi:hypothetical protein